MEKKKMTIEDDGEMKISLVDLDKYDGMPFHYFSGDSNVGKSMIVDEKYPNTNDKISEYLDYLEEFLIKKNEAYGDSLQNPNSVFSTDSLEGLKSRIDDKLNRIKSVGINQDTYDTIDDLCGYLIHLQIKIQSKTDEDM